MQPCFGMPPMIQARPPMVANPVAGAGAAGTAGSTRLYVSGIADELENEHLQAYFSNFGTVKDVYIPMNQQTGRRKQFAFITLATAEEAQAAASMSSHQVTEQHSVHVTLAAPKGNAPMGGAPMVPVARVPAATMAPPMVQV